MQNIQAFNNYSDLIERSKKSKEPIWVILENGNHNCLMTEVVENFWWANNRSFELIKTSGPTAEKIKKELSILKLPALIIFNRGNIKAIFQGLVAQHELTELLFQIK